MKQFDLILLKEIDAEFNTITENVEVEYKGEWDDKIHDSYLRYVKQVQDQSRCIHKIKSQIEEIMEEAQKLDIDDMKRMVDNLCGEAAAV